MFDKYINGYELLWKAIIRPPRENYDLKDLGIIIKFLGPKEFKFGKYVIKR